MNYYHSKIRLNGREVGIDDILSEKTDAKTEFESSTFRFIRLWHSENDHFSIHTSGSTGTPKEIIIRRHQMEASASATIKALGLSQDDTALVCLDTNFIAGKMMLVRSFVAGMRIVAEDPSSNPFANIGDNRISFTAWVPLQLEEVLKSGEKNRLNFIRNVLVGGAAVSPETIHRISEMDCNIIATYGMTETISHIALRRLNGKARQDHFETLPGVTVESDARGCLIINAFYLDQPLVTNDLVQVVSQTEFLWLGRYDNVINSGGIKLSPEVIEQMLEPLKPTINLHGRFIISAVNDLRLGERLVLVIEGSAKDTGRAPQQLEYLRTRLPKFHAPTQIVHLAAFPETKTGKINRTAIKIMLNSQA